MLNSPARGAALVLLLLLPGVAHAQEAWLDTSVEPSPFVPDGAQWITQANPGPDGAWEQPAIFTRTFNIAERPRRAIVAIAPGQYTEVRLDGELILTAYDRHESAPSFADVSAALTPGEHVLQCAVTSEWQPKLYAQLRIEHADGTLEDLCSDVDWSVIGAGGAPEAPKEIGEYHRKPGDSWLWVEFALLPMAQIEQHFAAHNEALRAAWAADQAGPFSSFAGEYESPDLAERYVDFRRLDRTTGQLLDANGREVHSFFTIYDQQRNGGWVLSIADFDYDQLERDLDLMAEAHVNPYMRQLGWDPLLDGRGNWRPCETQPVGTGLPHFELMRDVWDYFLDRAEAHGLHVVLETDWYWSAGAEAIPAPYRTRYHLYEGALEAQALAMRKIMRYFSQRTCILGYMAGEEDIVLAHDLENPHMRQRWARFLEEKYGTIERFIDLHPGGYDYADLGMLTQVSRAPEFITGAEAQPVLAPRLRWSAGVFDGLTSLDQVPMPYWPPYFTAENTAVPARAHRSYNDFTPDDPLWIDFYEMTEEHMLFDMLCRWVEIVRPGCPHQLLFYSNAQDLTTNWHFLHLFRRAELPFDVVGVGCHDSGKRCSDLAPWEMVRKSLKVVSGYRAYINANGALPVGIASGEGEGGTDPDDTLNYYRGALFDEIGGGAAWTQTYTWAQMSGARQGEDGGSGGAAPRKTPLLEWMGEFMSAHEHDPFPLARETPILVLRNENLQHSNRSGLDYGNAQELGLQLSQLNLDFDMAMASHVTYGPEEPFRIDLARYKVIILPTVACDLPTEAWAALDAWLTDPDHSGERALIIGLIENRSEYLAPMEAFPSLPQTWLGRPGYDGNLVMQDEVALTIDGAPGGAHAFTLGPGSRIGLSEGDDVFVRMADGRGLGVRREVNGNRVIGLGFFLGLNYNDLWGLAPVQAPFDAYSAFLEDLLLAAGLEPDIRAPHNVRVYPSADRRTLLVRERSNLPAQGFIELTAPEGISYAGSEELPDGRVRIPIELRPYEAVTLTAE